MRKIRLLSLIVFVPGCMTAWDPSWNKDSDPGETDVADTDTDSDADTDTDTDTDSDTDTGVGIEVVSGAIAQNTTWTSDTIWQLDGLVFVEPNVTLTIQRGTTILGLPGDGTPGSSGALIVAAGGQIFASGTASEPIVFTSANEPGQRAPGDWGGLVLLGKAPVNKPAARLEGIPDDDPRGLYGGVDVTHNCGVLQYVRVEFAGYKISANSELNALTLGGCGYNTTVENVQAHMGLDDGIEVFGGSVNLRQIVLTRNDDDSLDWDNGWNGYAQFVIVQQEAGLNDDGTTPQSDAGFEADNNDPALDPTFALSPKSEPTIWNATLIGSNSVDAAPAAMVLRRGTGGHFGNLLLTGYGRASIDLRDGATIDMLEAGDLDFQNVLLWDIGSDGFTYFEDEPLDGTSGDDDGGFSEPDYFDDPEIESLFSDPQMPTAAFDLAQPDFKPPATSPAAMPANAGDPPVDPQGFFRSAEYLGAVNPNAGTAWYDGWTAFPEN